MWESSGSSWKDSTFGLWSQKKTTARVQRMFSNRFAEEKFQTWECDAHQGARGTQNTRILWKHGLFFKLLLQTQGYGRVLKVLFGHFWVQKSSDADGLISKVTVFKDKALGKWLAREDSDFINELTHDRLIIWWRCWEMAEGNRWDIAEGSR